LPVVPCTRRVRAIGDLDGDRFDDFTLTAIVPATAPLSGRCTSPMGGRAVAEPLDMANVAAVFDLISMGIPRCRRRHDGR
jgi:hypothetical protein